MIISNKPNVKGIKSAVEDVRYRTQLMGRDQRLFAGLIGTRIYGMAVGFILAMLLIGLPALWVIVRGA
jgi:tetrahydromethanopterin S-methyltransferase subunit F